jgi:hypothetical protein
MIKSLVWCLLMASVFYACHNTSKQPSALVGNKHILQKINIVPLDTPKFELDSLTSPVVYSMQEYVEGDKRYLAYLNEETGTIYLNDFQTKRIVKRIEIHTDHKERLKKAFQGMLYHNKDSIFLFSYRPKVTLINDRGEVLKIFSIPKERSEANKLFYRGFYVSTSVPAYLYKTKLVINSVVVGDLKSNEKRNVQIILDLKTGEDTIGKVAFPPSYQGKNYGGLHYDIYYVSYNPKRNYSIYSFPANKNVLINNLLTGRTVSKPAESQFIYGFLTFQKDDYKEAVSEPVGEYYMTTPTYGSVLYDKYKNVYYRFALLPVQQRNVNYEQKNPPTKTISIAVFDDSFHYLGERQLDKNKYWSSNAFISKEGVNIQNKSHNDSTLNLTTFSFSFLNKNTVIN